MVIIVSEKIYIVLVAIYLIAIVYLGINTQAFNKAWRDDFKAWLKTYKNKPKVRVIAKSIISRDNQDEPVIFTRGRMDVYISADRIEATGKGYAVKQEFKK